MLGRTLFVTLTAAVLACHAAPRQQQLVDGVTNIKPEEQQMLVAKEVVNLIENYNYKKIQLNDSISSVIFDKYLKTLDGSKNYFLASDVKDFERFRYSLDDDFRNGDLSAPFYMYNVYMKRFDQWLKFSMSQINTKFDFTSNETFNYDREKLPYLNSQEELNKLWKQRFKYELLNLRIAGGTDAKNAQTLTTRYKNLQTQSAKTNSQDVFQVLMNSFTESIDPHTNYFTPPNATAFNEDMARSFEGIGARLQMENDVIKIAEIIPGGPAFKSKQLFQGDRITGVAQGPAEFLDLTGWRLDDAVSKIKGPKGTKVRLRIIPVGMELSAKPRIIELTRDRVVLEDQSAKKKVKTITENGKQYKIGIIEVPAFYADFKAANAGDPNYKSTTRDVRLLLDTLKNKDKVDAILMDLRSNGGGSLLEAIELTGLFIDRGPVVQVKDLRGKIDIQSDEKPGVAWDGPMGVMIDRLSASASEIFSGAIQDYGRGIIMGTQTYGKGTVQSAIDLNRVLNASILQRFAALVNKKNVKGANENPQLGQINLTMAKFYRVNGSSTQHKGVMPDINFPSIYPLDKIGEDTEPSALPWDEVSPSGFKPVADLRNVKSTLVALHNERMAKSLDYKFLKADIAEMQKRDAEQSITLNQAALKKERDEAEAKNLNRLNELRASRGLPPVKKGERPKKDDDYDFIQEESLRVMADFMRQNGSYVMNLPGARKDF
ncbi:carboxy terminal-processing peptidase [Pedobacter sp. SYP-B3415]|uniref:carboxy terminal-processing peptidase n=1 Tax=Pedobacter sp. SYP-B3415 TaxID=2496641 RepID=UPI001F1054FD|nr:carboxy terminal-processing peptidase [Pedobacter sp. SYP-B3415]